MGQQMLPVYDIRISGQTVVQYLAYFQSVIVEVTLDLQISCSIQKKWLWNDILGASLSCLIPELQLDKSVTLKFGRPVVATRVRVHTSEMGSFAKH